MHGAFVPAAAARLSTRATLSAAAAATPASTGSAFLASLRPRRVRAATAAPRARTAHATVPAMGLFDAIKSAGASMLSQPEPMQVVRVRRCSPGEGGVRGACGGESHTRMPMALSGVCAEPRVECVVCVQARSYKRTRERPDSDSRLW